MSGEVLTGNSISTKTFISLELCLFKYLKENALGNSVCLVGPWDSHSVAQMRTGYKQKCCPFSCNIQHCSNAVQLDSAGKKIFFFDHVHIL